MIGPPTQDICQATILQLTIVDIELSPPFASATWTVLSTEPSQDTAEHDLIAAHLNSQGASLTYTIASSTLILDVVYELELRLENSAGFVGRQYYSIMNTFHQAPIMTHTDRSDFSNFEAIEAILSRLPESCVDEIPPQRIGGERNLLTVWSQDNTDIHQLPNLDSFVLSHSNNQSLFFPPRALQPGVSYTFEATSTVQDRPTESATIQVSIDIRPSRVVPVTDSENRSIGVESELRIDASGSYDEDDLDWETSDENLAFEWRCSQNNLTNPSNTAAASCTKFDESPLILSGAGSVLYLPPQTLLWNQLYVFTLHITKDTKEAKKVIAIKALEGLSLPYASLKLLSAGNITRDYVNPHEELHFKAVVLSKTPDNMTYEWTISGFNADDFDGPLNRREIKLKSWKATPGSTFSIYVFIRDEFGIAEASMTVNVNDVPTDGVLTITPESGVPVTSDFELSAGQAWADQNGITAYQFACYFTLEDIGVLTKRTVLSPATSTPFLRTKLPKPTRTDNTLILELRVFDSRDGYKVVTKTVTLQALMINSVADKQSLADNLLNVDKSSASAQILQNVKLMTSVLSANQDHLPGPEVTCPCVNGNCSDPLKPFKCTCNSGYIGKICTISESDQKKESQLRTQLLNSSHIVSPVLNKLL